MGRKAVLRAILALLLQASAAGAQEVRDTVVLIRGDTVRMRITTSTSTWGPGDRGTLPVRAHFVTTSAANLLDSATVREAILAAMLHTGIEPDLEFGPFAARHETPPFLSVEVDSYEAGEVRIEVALIEAGRAWRPACGGGSTGKQATRLGAALRITHEVRDAIQCSLRGRGR